MLVDDAAGVANVKYSIQRLASQDNPVHEQPQGLWPAGVFISAAGRVSALLEMQDSSVENAVRGVAIRAYDRSTITGEITDLRWTACATMASSPGTGFLCSGLDQTSKIACIARSSRQRR